MKVDVWYLIGNALDARVTLQAQLDALEVSLTQVAIPDEITLRYYLNRMVPQRMTDGYVKLIHKYRPGADIIVDEFSSDEYCAHTTRKGRRLYGFGTNLARNAMVDLSFQGDADYCFPLDCRNYVPHEAWIKLLQDLNSQPEYGYYIMGQGQINEGESPERPITTIDFWEGDIINGGEIREYLIGFGRGHDLQFHPNITYGQDCRTELLASLGVPGGWVKKHGVVRHTEHYQKYGKASYAMLLPSGRANLDKHLEARRKVQQQSVSQMLQTYEDLFNA